MGRYGPHSHSSPETGHGSRGGSPPRSRHGGPNERKKQGPVTLLVCNIPFQCRLQDLRVSCEKFGLILDVYRPTEYYTTKPKGFAFVEFAEASDASEAKHHMDRQMFSGREIKVIAASDKRKRPEEMRRQSRAKRYSDREGDRISRYGRSRSHSRSLSRSPCDHGRARSRKRDKYSDSPKKMEEGQAKSRRHSKEHDELKKRRFNTPDGRIDRHDTDNGSDERLATPEGHKCCPGSRSRRRDDYSISPKRNERRANSPRQSREHGDDKGRSNAHHDRIADNVLNGATRRRDVYSASPKRKEEHRVKSWILSKEQVEYEKRRSYTLDARNELPDANDGYKERRATPDYASSKGREDCHTNTSEQSKEHDKDKKLRPYICDVRNDHPEVDNGSEKMRVTDEGEVSRPRQRSPRPSSGSRSRKRDDHSASPKRKEERWAKSPGQSKEHDEDKKRKSHAHDDKNHRSDADNAYNTRGHGYSASLGRKEERQTHRQSKRHDKDKKRRSYTPDARNGRRDIDKDKRLATPEGDGSHPRSCSRRHNDHSASSKRKEERQAKSPRQSKEHDVDDDKRRSYTRDDRS